MLPLLTVDGLEVLYGMQGNIAFHNVMTIGYIQSIIVWNFETCSYDMWLDLIAAGFSLLYTWMLRIGKACSPSRVR